MTEEQLGFLQLHRPGSDLVEEWRQIFQGAMIRVRTMKGKTATIAHDAVQSLIDDGLIAPGCGGSFYLTDKGKNYESA